MDGLILQSESSGREVGGAEGKGDRGQAVEREGTHVSSSLSLVTEGEPGFDQTEFCLRPIGLRQ